jgi:hypothetical protein
MEFGGVRKFFSLVIGKFASALNWCFTRPAYRRFVAFMRDLFHALWICRVSAVSVALGILVFWIAPQSRDIFLEIAGHLGTKEGSWVKNLALDNALRSSWFALQFCLALLFLWVIPLHGAARWSLDSLANPPRTLLGQKTALLTAPRPRLDPWVVKWTPRALGFLCFVAIGIGLYYAFPGQFDARVKTAALAGRQLQILTVAIVITAAVYCLYFRYRFDIFKQTLGRTAATRISVRRTATGQAVSGPGVALLRLLGGATVVLVTALLAWYVLVPQDKAEYVLTFQTRALIIPLVLGASVPFFSLVTWLSYPARIPILTIIILATVAYKAFWHEGHDIRRLDESLPAGIDLNVAIDRWREANGCLKQSDGSPADPGLCPSPIIVAAAGAASRAAFMTGSTLGYFMDLTCPPDQKQAFFRDRKDPNNQIGCPGPRAPLFATRTFAISAVSGGAVAASAFSALLREYVAQPSEQRNEAGVPCQGYSRLWLRPGPPLGWRDCMQMILSQDFLSPPIIALAFRDQWPILDAIFPQHDRAAALEDAWIEAFDKFAPRPATSKRPERKRIFAEAFDKFAPDGPAAWRPLLVLNGTSVADGRRIVTSHLAFDAKFKSKDGKEEIRPIFNDAYDIREILAQGGKTPRAFSLATATTNSARFPLISPQGVLRGSDDVKVDRVVDGGFFENFGVTTANDIARVLVANQLKPVILLVTNDPTSVARTRQLDDLDYTSPQLPDARDAPLLDWIGAPLEALYATRTSRGELAILRTGQESHGTEKDVVHIPITNITVYGELAKPEEKGKSPQFKEVSWSWWLSKPVQEYLDNQFFMRSYSGGFDENPNKASEEWLGEQVIMLDRVCNWLRDRPQGQRDPLVDQCRKNVRCFLVKERPEDEKLCRN